MFQWRCAGRATMRLLSHHHHDRSSVPSFCRGWNQGWNGVYHWRGFASSTQLIQQDKPYKHYIALNVPPNASDEQIKQAYYQLCKLYHPDMNQNKNSDSSDSSVDEAKFSQITEAYDILMDPDQRKMYDFQCQGVMRTTGDVSYSAQKPFVGSATAGTASVLESEKYNKWAAENYTRQRFGDFNRSIRDKERRSDKNHLGSYKNDFHLNGHHLSKFIAVCVAFVALGSWTVVVNWGGDKKNESIR